ncbi:MAG: DUF2283 domain-containing protein [Caldilineaceae bacterium]|nr:DUF2283 domain-containing protein [Caldilineaceae bacterium]
MYDDISDTLYISFAPGETGTGVEINENLLLRINKAERRAVGLSIFDYSLLAQPTETGRRSLPLTGLSEVSRETRAIIFDILSHPPVADILTLSSYTPCLHESIPLVSFRDAISPVTA